jgi:prepilin-type N-terminal cleavage/methylation domain-containing protein
MPRLPRQTGFTMVEVAVVMLIAGLIFGSVLKNRELIDAATAKRLASDFRNVSIAIHTYQGAHHALPGDDRDAARHVAGTPAATPAGALGNGRIDGAWNSLTPTDEAYLAWQHLRLANLLAGTPNVPAAPAAGDAYNPRHGAEGRLGLSSDAVLTSALWPANYYVCAAGLPGRLVRRLEVMVDDGNTLTGDLRAICEGECSAGAGVAVTVANEAATFTVCVAH